MGAYLSIISGAIKLFNYLAAALQQHHDEMTGANRVVAADLKEANDADQKALKAAVDTTDKSVRDSLSGGSF